MFHIRKVRKTEVGEHGSQKFSAGHRVCLEREYFCTSASHFIGFWICFVLEMHKNDPMVCENRGGE